MSPKVSVIIPVYGVEKTIERCAESLFSQTLDDIEYVFVNDCTPDNSIDILKKVIKRYPSRQNRIHIIEMATNSRQAAARNVGLNYAAGEYIIHCDPDDWVDSGLYEEMYTEASIHDYDIVACNYIVEYKHNNTWQKCILPAFSNPLDVLCCEHYYILSLWAHMVRRSVITDNSLRFFTDINCSEDVGFMSRIFALSKTMGHISTDDCYHYVKSEQSITTNLDSCEYVAQRVNCLRLIDKFMLDQGMDLSRLSMILRLKRDVKNVFLKPDTLDKWVKLFPEVCKWECKQPESSTIYKFAYYLSHKFARWPMSLLLKLHKQ